MEISNYIDIDTDELFSEMENDIEMLVERMVDDTVDNKIDDVVDDAVTDAVGKVAYKLEMRNMNNRVKALEKIVSGLQKTK